MRAEKNGKIESVSLLRIAFIIFILLEHFREYVRYDFFRGFIFEYGFTGFLAQIGVSGFIFISGLTLTFNYQNKKKDLKGFIYKRFIRLIPPYYVVVLLHVIPVMNISIPNVLSHLVLINTFVPSFSHNPGSIWFISLIFQFYFLFPFLFALIKKRHEKLLLGLAFIGYLIGQFLMTHMGLYLEDSAFYYLSEFGFGMLIARHQLRYPLRPPSLLLIFMMLGFALRIASVSENAFACQVINKCFIISAVLFIFYITNLLTFGIHVPQVMLSFSDSVLYVFLFHRLIWMVMLRLWNPEDLLLRFVYLGIFGVPLIFVISKWLQVFYDGLIEKYALTELSGLKLFFKKYCAF